MRRLVFAVIGLGLVAIVAIGLSQSEGGGSGGNPFELESAAPPPAEVRAALAGAPAPLARLHTRANTLVPGGPDAYARELRALRGHPVVVNVWGSWCGPCRLEWPHFQTEAVRFGRRVGFLGVDVRDNAGDARELLRDLPVTYPSVEDPDYEVATELRLRGVPGTAFYDRRGRLAYRHQGPYSTAADLRADIERYLGVGA